MLLFIVKVAVSQNDSLFPFTGYEFVKLSNVIANLEKNDYKAIFRNNALSATGDRSNSDSLFLKRFAKDSLILLTGPEVVRLSNYIRTLEKRDTLRTLLKGVTADSSLSGEGLLGGAYDVSDNGGKVSSSSNKANGPISAFNEESVSSNYSSGANNNKYDKYAITSKSRVKVVYKVQIGSYKTKPGDEVDESIRMDEIEKENYKDGMTRVTYGGKFKKLSKAYEKLELAREKGYDDAFVIAIIDDKRVYLKDLHKYGVELRKK